jgi:hypothetical protein
MKMKTLFLTMAFCLCALAAGFAENPNIGSWKLDEAKSKIAEGSPKNTSVVYTAEGDSLKCVVEGTDATGAATHNEWTGKFDGKDYAVTGDPNSDTRAIKMVDETHYKLTSKKAGKVVMTGTVETSADGKSRTLVTSAKDAKGKKITNTFVYDKQ